MAGQFDVHIVTAALGAHSGAVAQPLFKNSTLGGGITVLEAHMLSGGGTANTAGTVIGGVLVTMTDAGTPAVNGTIGAFTGTITPSGTAPDELVISDGFVDAGEWVGFDQASGTVPAVAYITLSYVMGR